MVRKRALDVRREGFRAMIGARKLTVPKLASLAKVPASTLYSYLAGAAQSLRGDTEKKLADALKVSISELYQEQDNQSEPVELPVENLKIVGEIAAGVWVEENGYEEPYETLPVTPDSRFAGMKQFALRVRGPSMNKIMQENEFAICVDFWDIGREAKTDDIVVVTRTRKDGQLRETTLKQVVVAKSGVIELWPRSTDPKHQEPVLLTDGEEDGVAVAITAFVIARHVPLL